MANHLHESQETRAATRIAANSGGSGGAITQPAHDLSGIIEVSNSVIRKWFSYLAPRSNLCRRWLVASLSHLRSSMDTKATIRFTVVVFSHLMGVATTFSVDIAPGRPTEALSSLGDDGYPIMVAQVAASLLSPLLFSIVSTKDRSTPLWQKIVSFYYLLLVAGVVMSLVSLLLYSFWPAGYRVTNLTIMASLMFGVLGGWQFLEKCWKETSESEDIELGVRQI
ncbi:hypothetical protein F5B19DRAFT_495297 [Rostrohypoxylon terebratum]|nr:hypothetical protein F5B19DRAFT_495297 [Rostrohypoxylon terebratum]